MRKAAPRTAITERQNPRSRNLDQKSTRQILRLINREDARIARAADEIASRIRKGGRLLYIGAGTSGRLGVLDASECPPTFGVPRTLVQGIIAGGNRALTESVEGAEDHEKQGARDLRARRMTSRDAVVGLAASGSTPYVLGALKYARKRGAFTIGVTMNRRAAIARLAHVTIAPATGPEVVAGSTRMKAGTAQKMVLNMLSTTVMIRLGHVYDNWMVKMMKTNQKLRERAVRNLREATGAQVLTAEHALRQAGDDLQVALIILKAGLDARRARLRLAAAHGNLRKALASGNTVPATGARK